MKISIIVPVYNAEKTIEYCIDSIITQKTKFEIELILVEDYSTDRSYEICLALKKKYTEIKLYRTNGKGVSAARNTGLSHSTGDVVGFCDSDDIYEKDVFEKVRLFFENKDIDIVIGGFYYSKKDSLSTIARTTIAGAIINVLVNLALIRFIGLYAASISTLVSYASTALYRRIDIRKYIKIKVNVKNILLNSVAVVFVTLSYYFNITILNVAALVIACIYAVGINWKLIKMFFAEIRKYKKEGN